MEQGNHQFLKAVKQQKERFVAEEKPKFISVIEGAPAYRSAGGNGFYLVRSRHHYPRQLAQTAHLLPDRRPTASQQKFIKKHLPEATIWVSNQTWAIISLFSNLLVRSR